MLFHAAVFVELFPLILPIWTSRPITREDIVPGPYPVVITEAQIRTQQEAFAIADRELRCDIARDLRDTGLRSAFLVLANRLGKEADARVLATVLEQLGLMEFDDADLPRRLDPLLKHADQDVRYWALALYGRLERAVVARLAPVLFDDPSESVRALASEIVLTRYSEAPSDMLRKMWEDSRPLLRARGLTAAAMRSDVPESRDRVRAAATDGHAVVRAALAEALDRMIPPLRDRLVPVLARDSHAAVRGAVASSVGEAGEARALPTLLELTRDPDAEVRRRAVEACAAFPTPAVLDACADRVADERELVRRQAQETLVAIDSEAFVGDKLATLLPVAPVYARHHIYRVLGRLDHRQFADGVSERLKGEKDARNVASAVFALGQFEARFAAAQVAGLAGHPDAGVREEVARALGRMAVPATFDKIKVLAFDSEEPVREAAIVSMGLIADGSAFGVTLRKVMETVNEMKMSSANRAAGAWASGRCRPVDPDLMKRLVVQGTTPVVPGEMGEKLFEEDYVLVSVALALATCARHDAATRPLAETVLDAHSVVLPPGAIPEVPEALVPSAEVVEYARQARALMNGGQVTPLPRPTTTMSFAYDTLKHR
jgi:HEAT repeat protein